MSKRSQVLFELKLKKFFKNKNVKVINRGINVVTFRRSPLLVDDFESIVQNSSYWRELSRTDLCEECRSSKPSADPTVVPYVYSLHLFSRALKTATRKKCGRSLICDGLRTMPPAEWRDILEETVTVVGDNRLRFYMQLESALEIFARGDAGFEVVSTPRQKPFISGHCISDNCRSA